MNNLTIVGAGTAGISLAQDLRSRDAAIPITVIEKNSYWVSRKKYWDNLAIKEKTYLPDWAKEKNITLVQDEVDRVNPERKKIYLKNSEPQNFGTLIIAAGLKSREIPAKGGHRDGFVYLSDIDPFKVRDLLKISSDAVVYAATALGLRLAGSLKAAGKDVTVVAGDWSFLGDDKAVVLNALSDSGIAVYSDSVIEEAIGEGTVRAVKLSPLKVLSAQMLFVDSGFTPNYNFFDQPLVRDGAFSTNHTDVYLLGDAAVSDIENERFFLNNFDDCLIQSRALADFLCDGKPPHFERRIVSAEEKKRYCGGCLKPKAV